MAKKSVSDLFPLKANLRRRDNGVKVAAAIRPMKPTDIPYWAEWRYRETDEDRSWDWDGIFTESLEESATTECYALVARDAIQGLMCMDIQPQETGSGASPVVVYLATSPSNRTGDKGLKDVGGAMIGAAVMRSRELGMDGKLWLESLPGAEAVYLALGFTRQADKSQDGWAVFTLSGESAAVLIDALRGKGVFAG